MPIRMSAHEWKMRCMVPLLCLLGCDENEATRRYPDVFNAAPSARDSVMLTFPLEDQIEIYLLGIRYRHPPAIYLGQTLAQHGEKIVPDMMRRLDKAKEDWEKRYLLFVLGFMSCWEVDLSVREEIIEAARTAAATMSNRPDIEQAEESIRMIKREACPKNSPGYEGGINGNVDSVQGRKKI